MADVYHQLYVHVVFAVRNRQALISEKWEDSLHKYLSGIINHKGHKALAIGGMPDHIHIFLALKPSEALSDLVRELKKSSQTFISNQGFTSYQFRWQNGYGAFSYSRSQIKTVCKYVQNQKSIHNKKTFKDEYDDLIKEFGIDRSKKESFDFF